jgi:hypothetical protein
LLANSSTEIAGDDVNDTGRDRLLGRPTSPIAATAAMSDVSRRLAWIAGGAAVAFSVGIWVLARSQGGLNPPDLVPRPLVSAILLATPGVLGWIGAATERRTLLVAAGILCTFQSVIAFSGVTLIYLVPGIMFLRAAAADPDATTGRQIRPLNIVLAALLSVPIALFVIVTVGLLGIVLLIAIVMITALAAGRGSETGSRAVTGRDVGLGVAVVLLVIGAWAATLAITETTCWEARQAPDGGLAWERIPPTDELTVGADVVASTCGSGTLTPTGIVIAATLLVGALAIAAVPAGRVSRATTGPRS